MEEEKAVIVKKAPTGDGNAARTAAYNDVYSITRDHRAAVRAYCAGNKWLTENAKDTGNW